MVVEDDDIFLEFDQRLLEKSGLCAGLLCYDRAEPGLAELSRRWETREPFPDFILLDLRMPSVNGFDFLERLKAFPAEVIGTTRIFMLTSSLEETDISRAFTYPHVFGFISKPLSVAKIEELVSTTVPIRPAGF